MFVATNSNDSSGKAPSIEEFTVIKPISRGAFGKVFLGRRHGRDQLYAIKVMQKLELVNKNMAAQVRTERDALALSHSPFIVHLFYSIQSTQYIYLMMEYLIGGDLKSLLHIYGYFDLDMAVVYTAEVILALEYLHRHSIIHRDLKPDNLLVADDGHIKLTDFGLSRIDLDHKLDVNDVIATPSVSVQKSDYFRTPGQILSLTSKINFNTPAPASVLHHRRRRSSLGINTPLTAFDKELHQGHMIPPSVINFTSVSTLSSVSGDPSKLNCLSITHSDPGLFAISGNDGTNGNAIKTCSTPNLHHGIQSSLFKSAESHIDNSSIAGTSNSNQSTISSCGDKMEASLGKTLDARQDDTYESNNPQSCGQGISTAGLKRKLHGMEQLSCSANFSCDQTSDYKYENHFIENASPAVTNQSDYPSGVESISPSLISPENGLGHTEKQEKISNLCCSPGVENNVLMSTNTTKTHYKKNKVSFSPQEPSRAQHYTNFSPLHSATTPVLLQTIQQDMGSPSASEIRLSCFETPNIRQSSTDHKCRPAITSSFNSSIKKCSHSHVELPNNLCSVTAKPITETPVTTSSYQQKFGNQKAITETPVTTSSYQQKFENQKAITETPVTSSYQQKALSWKENLENISPAVNFLRGKIALDDSSAPREPAILKRKRKASSTQSSNFKVCIQERHTGLTAEMFVAKIDDVEWSCDQTEKTEERRNVGGNREVDVKVHGRYDTEGSPSVRNEISSSGVLNSCASMQGVLKSCNGKELQAHRQTTPSAYPFKAENTETDRTGLSHSSEEGDFENLSHSSRKRSSISGRSSTEGFSRLGQRSSTSEESPVATFQTPFKISLCTPYKTPKSCRRKPIHHSESAERILGTPDYLAPEILLRKPHGMPVDWWALGVCFFEFLTGIPPFNDQSPELVFQNILARDIPWPCGEEALPVQAQQLVELLLTSDPDERPQAKDLKQNPFFESIDWDHLREQPAPFVPHPDDATDTTYFEPRNKAGNFNISSFDL